MYCQTNWVNIRKRIDIIRTHVTLTKHLLSDYTAARRPKSSNGLDWNRSERNSCMLQCTLAIKATQRIASDRTLIKTFSVVLPSRSENTTCSNVKTVRYLPLNGYSRSSYTFSNNSFWLCLSSHSMRIGERRAAQLDLVFIAFQQIASWPSSSSLSD